MRCSESGGQKEAARIIDEIGHDGSTGKLTGAVEAWRLRGVLEQGLGVTGKPAMRSCGARMSRRARGRRLPKEPLSAPREQAVAALVASGKTNREVGAELYLSSRAVEYHLANIFAKVGVRLGTMV